MCQAARVPGRHRRRDRRDLHHGLAAARRHPRREEEARLWLYGVARRVLANHFRAEERRTALAARLREEAASWAVPDRTHDPAYQAFQRLSDDDRELLSLVAWEGLSGPEIAKVLGCSRGAARIRLHRARKRLAKELAALDPDIAAYGSRAVSLANGH
ncbi:sigma-70 family RNA polymerase sigma factor [Nonomuraea sp. N2-4H]|uniref:RNA polymerase sigma factor n=1 Tax=Nonomuraea sp. N2-4H TaxID=3128898 RepID=UPI00324EB00B